MLKSILKILFLGGTVRKARKEAKKAQRFAKKKHEARKKSGFLHSAVFYPRSRSRWPGGL